MTKTTTITLVKDSDKKHSIKFKAVQTDPNSPPAITDAYIMRSFTGIDAASTVKVTIEIP